MKIICNRQPLFFTKSTNEWIDIIYIDKHEYIDLIDMLYIFRLGLVPAYWERYFVTRVAD